MTQQCSTKMVPYIAWIYIKTNIIKNNTDYIKMLNFIFDNTNHQNKNMFVYRES